MRRLKKMTFAEKIIKLSSRRHKDKRMSTKKIRVQKMQHGCLGKFRITERCQLSSTLNGFGSMKHLQDWLLGKSRIKFLYGVVDSYYYVVTHKQQTQRNLSSQTCSLQVERYEQAAQDLECLIWSLENLREACKLMALPFPPFSKAGWGLICSFQGKGLQ